MLRNRFRKREASADEILQGVCGDRPKPAWYRTRRRIWTFQFLQVRSYCRHGRNREQLAGPARPIGQSALRHLAALPQEFGNVLLGITQSYVAISASKLADVCSAGYRRGNPSAIGYC